MGIHLPRVTSYIPGLKQYPGFLPSTLLSRRVMVAFHLRYELFKSDIFRRNVESVLVHPNAEFLLHCGSRLTKQEFLVVCRSVGGEQCVQEALEAVAQAFPDDRVCDRGLSRLYDSFLENTSGTSRETFMTLPVVP